MNKLILGISIFFIILTFYVYKQKEHFQNDASQNNSSTVNIPLTDSSNKYEENPLLLLPPPSGGGGSTDKYDMSAQDNSNNTPKDGGNPMINVYVSPIGKIHFKKSEIEQVFGGQLSKFNKINKETPEDSEYGVAKLMVPLTWKAMANQYGQFKRLIDDIENIKKGLNTANITMNKIQKEADSLTK